jgi:hypothetical protein
MLVQSIACALSESLGRGCCGLDRYLVTGPIRARGSQPSTTRLSRAAHTAATFFGGFLPAAIRYGVAVSGPCGRSATGGEHGAFVQPAESESLRRPPALAVENTLTSWGRSARPFRPPARPQVTIAGCQYGRYTHARRTVERTRPGQEPVERGSVGLSPRHERCCDDARKGEEGPRADA